MPTNHNEGQKEGLDSGRENEWATDALNKQVEIIDGLKQIETDKVYEILKAKGYRKIQLPNQGNEV